MQTAIIMLLALVCAALLYYLFELCRGLRVAGERLAAHLEDETTARLDVSCPNASAEALLQEVNALLERRLAEGADYRRKEEDLRRQIADVSHDLRTPLTSILGYLQLLEEQDLTPEQKGECLAVIRGRAATLQTLITSFYDLSRLEGGQWQLEREELDLKRIVQDQLASAYETLERAGMPPEVDIAPDLPLVWGDQKAAVRVVSNLLTNALTHGAAPLRFSLRRAGEGVAARFTNGAPTMTQVQVEQVFQRSYTSDPSRTGQGTGLGLAIVRALMERMGGEARADLADGQFTVTLTFRAVRDLGLT